MCVAGGLSEMQWTEERQAPLHVLTPQAQPAQMWPGSALASQALAALSDSEGHPLQGTSQWSTEGPGASDRLLNMFIKCTQSTSYLFV